MDAETVSNIFAVTLLIAAATTIVMAALPPTRAVLSRSAPIVVAVTAAGATAGSLYYSEVANYTPCLYCWYQRIAMYPIAVIVPVALVFRDRGILRSSLALAGIGLAISIYHIQLQLFPDQGSDSCGLTSPCTARWVDALGFMSIPQMAGIAFGIIVVTSILGLRSRPATPVHPGNS